ncbi:peptidoglycan editing factor PgeF [Faunimonas sp. B44]|uniref:peptidoglycan editing factor PgeF n=1 Tax=Faunimonas sp. B44 TaxID=3461493 RepID=UPI0040441AA0
MKSEHQPLGVAAPGLDQASGVAHRFFTRQGGVSTGLYGAMNTGLGSQDDRQAVLENRSRAAAALDVAPDRLATPYQIHSAEAVVVDAPWGPGLGPQADAVVTNRPGIAIGVGTADCGPILFADGQAGVIGAAHAGWKGALTGVLEAAIEAMERLGADRSRMVAVLGPTISPEAYEVGPEFVARFLAADEANEEYFRADGPNGRARFDLPGYIAARLRAAGLGTVETLALCTYADEERFFSYRRATHRGEPDYGRQLSAIALREH